MTDDTNTMLTPELRFPEFRDQSGWKSKELRSIASPVSERADNEDSNNILTLSGEHGLVLQTEYFGKQIAGTNSERYLKIQRDDFVYNDRTTKASEYGTIKRLSKHPHGIVSPIYKCFRFDEDEHPDFWEWYFESGAHDAQLRSLANEGARAGRFNVSIDRFLSTIAYVPEPSSGEQQKIAECLSTLDELIGAESQKLDALKDHKKGLMQQLFPREGETLPRLRFPKFQNAAEWEEASLGEFVNFESGGTPSKQNSDFWGGTIPWISAKDMKQLFLDDGEDHITTAAAEDGAKQVPAGTVLMLTRGMTLFKDVPICVVRRPMSFNQDVKALRVKKSVIQGFLPYLLLANKQRLLESVDAAGHGTGRLNTEELKALKFRYPLQPEQMRIAHCLDLLESLIPAQSGKLEALKTHKKGLMQQLFPAAPEAGS